MSSEKPQISQTSEKLTDTVVNSTNQQIKNAAPTATVSSINAYGIKTMRGGTVLGTGFLESALNAYTNLFSYNPIALILFVVVSYYYIGLIVGVTNADPFTLMLSGVVTKQTQMTNAPGKALLAAASGFFNFIDNYKSFFAIAFGFTAVYLAKPSTRNAIFSGILTLTCVIFHFDSLMILATIHLFFLYTQLRDPKHKTIIILIAVIAIFIGSTNMANLVDMKSLTTKYNKGG
ncbi:structural protein 1 [Ceratitis capitata negev-like virus 2]|nr:structural protein 1 [Ceratitis capitata negev-like virus 2]